MESNPILYKCNLVENRIIIRKRSLTANCPFSNKKNQSDPIF